MLSAVDLTVERGAVVAVVGRSGSGKSTLLNLVGAVDVPTEGDVRVAGESIVSGSEHRRALYRRRSVGFVFQFFNLIPTLTVAENVRLPLELNDVDETSIRRRVAELLDAVGLADRSETFPERLSGGEQQRIAVARALVHRPVVVLADEPTGNLDVDAARDVLTLLLGLARDAGSTVLIATHSEEAAAVADRVIGLREGRVAERRHP